MRPCSTCKFSAVCLTCENAGEVEAYLVKNGPVEMVEIDSPYGQPLRVNRAIADFYGERVAECPWFGGKR